MSAFATTWAYDQHPERSGEKFILVTLAQFADAFGYCYPGQGKLARLTEMGERTVRGHLDSLERQEIIRIEERRREDGTRTSNGYWLLGPAEAFGPPADPAGSQQAADSAGSSEQGERSPSNRQISPAAGSAGHESKANKEEVSKRRACVEPPARPDVEELCSQLATRIIANGGSTAKYRDRAKTRRWHDDMRKLLDIDLAEYNGTAAERVAKAIDWCQADDFWRGVVLSPAKLREKYDELRLQAQRQQNGQRGNVRSLSAAAAERAHALAVTQAKLAKGAQQ